MSGTKSNAHLTGACGIDTAHSDEDHAREVPMPLWYVWVAPFEAVAGQWEDERPGPIFDESILATTAEAEKLQKQLEHLADNEVIGEWRVEKLEPPLGGPAGPDAVIDRIESEFDAEADDDNPWAILSDAGLL